MARSKKELKSLESAYKVCLLVHENSSNVITGSTEFENIEADINWYNQALEFIDWYEGLYGRTNPSQKKINV